MCSRKGFSAGKPKSFIGSSDLKLPSKPRHHSHHWYHTPLPGDYQIWSCSSRAVISNFGIMGAWAAKHLDKFTSLPRYLKTSTCVRHPLWHGKTTTPANSQLQRTPPSLKTSPLADFGFVLLGYHRRQKVPGHLRIGSWYMHILPGAFQPAYYW